MKINTALLIVAALCGVALAGQSKPSKHGAKESAVNTINDAAPTSDSSEESGQTIVIVNKVCGEGADTKGINAAGTAQLSPMGDSDEAEGSDENKIVIINKIGCDSAESTESDESDSDSATLGCKVVCIADIGNQYRPHPTDCSSYIQCSEGTPYVMSCSSGLVWDESIDACNYPASAPKCEPRTCSTVTIEYRVGDEWLSMSVDAAKKA